MKAFIPLVALLVVASSLNGQSSTIDYSPLDSSRSPAALRSAISLDVMDMPRREILTRVADQAQVSIVFEASSRDVAERMTIRVDRAPAASVVLRVIAGTRLRAFASPSGTIVLREANNEALTIGGVVSAGAPVNAAHVSLVGTRFEATTNERGEFDLGQVPSGSYQLRVVRIGYQPIAMTVDAARARKLELEMNPVAVPLAAVVITPGVFSVIGPAAAAAQSLSRTQIETMPQLGEDAYRAVARLPGVATTDLSAKFAIRGEPGDELLVTLDGMPLVEPFHLRDAGSALSIVDLASLGSAELITGGPGAEFGNQTAGVFQLRTLDPRESPDHTTIGFSLTNVRAMSQGRFASGNGGWLVSGRRGFLDLAFKMANLADSIYPRYDDAFAKLVYTMPTGGHVAVHALHAGDRLRYQDSREPRLDSRYSSDYAWATWGHRHNDIAMWVGSLDWRRGGSGADLNRSWPFVQVSDQRTFQTSGARDDAWLELGSRTLIKVGGEIRREWAAYAYARGTRREVVANNALTTIAESLGTNTRVRDVTGGTYALGRVRLAGDVAIEGGLRLEPAQRAGPARLDPRVAASWQPTAGSTIRTSWGRYSQIQSLFSLQVQDGVQSFDAPDHAHQFVVGWDQRWGLGVSTRAEVYRRTFDHIRPAFANVTTAIAAFPELAFDRVYVAPTGGSSSGIEVSVSKPVGERVDWNANISHGRATQTIDGRQVPRAGDQVDQLHGDWSIHPASNKWRFTLSAFVHSGAPYTPDSVRIDTIAGASGVPFARATWLAGSLYSRRAPWYHRVDVRWTRYVDLPRGRLTFFTEVYNVLNTSNVRDRYTNVSINQLSVRYVERTREQLPRIPSFGLSWEF